MRPCVCWSTRTIMAKLASSTTGHLRCSGSSETRKYLRSPPCSTRSWNSWSPRPFNKVAHVTQAYRPRRGGINAMSQTTQEKNKALVLDAFDALFNRRDYASAERYWSPRYIQHSAHIAPGREGLITLVRSLPPTLKY